MRIITGIYKGRNLFTVSGASTRPTTSFNRELIFSTWQDYQDKRVLDLFAGTGSFGLEALSRGASWVDFVEFASAAIGILLKNIDLLKCSTSCHVYRRRVEDFLRDTGERWDLIFLDPPYNKNLVNPCLHTILERGLLQPGGVVIAEHSPSESIAAELVPHLLNSKPGKSTQFSILAEEFRPPNRKG